MIKKSLQGENITLINIYAPFNTGSPKYVKFNTKGEGEKITEQPEGEGNGKPLWYFYLENAMDRGYSPWDR